MRRMKTGARPPGASRSTLAQTDGVALAPIAYAPGDTPALWWSRDLYRQELATDEQTRRRLALIQALVGPRNDESLLDVDEGSARTRRAFFRSSTQPVSETKTGGAMWRRQLATSLRLKLSLLLVVLGVLGVLALQTAMITPCRPSRPAVRDVHRRLA